MNKFVLKYKIYLFALFSLFSASSTPYLFNIHKHVYQSSWNGIPC